MPGQRVRTAHRVPGRIRLKVHGSKGKHHTLEEFKRIIAPMQGVRGVETNASTGSLVVHYDAARYPHFHRELQERGASTGAFMLDPPEIGEGAELVRNIELEAQFLAQHSETARVIIDYFRGVDNVVRRATNNAVDLKVLLPLGLAVYSFIEIGLEASTPLWVTLGIFSFNSFVALHHPQPTVAQNPSDDRNSNERTDIPG